MQGCDAMPGAQHTFWIGGVLQGPEEHQAALSGWHWHRVAIRDGKQVLVVPVPLGARHGGALCQLGGVEAEEILQRWLVGLFTQSVVSEKIFCARPSNTVLGIPRLLAIGRGTSAKWAVARARDRRTIANIGVRSASFLGSELVQPGELFQCRVVPVDHVLLVEDVLRDNPLHDLHRLCEILRYWCVHAHPPWHHLFVLRCGLCALPCLSCFVLRTCGGGRLLPTCSCGPLRTTSGCLAAGPSRLGGCICRWHRTA
mmetsp:Transcript_82757/g.208318  ORF Transcript_82757/g.208318 Transcript_82757/m.208318 type:complete len:256 (+) Transcript_82757:1042-1809(+)